MKKYLIILLLSSIYSVGFSKDNSIPKSFHGTWEIAASDCGKLSDSTAKIDVKNINWPEKVCELKNALRANLNKFRGIFVCSGEGEISKENISLTFSGNKLGINGPPSMVRCRR